MFMIERQALVYSLKDGDTIVWRKVRGQPDGKPLTWATEREARAFADLFCGQDDYARVVAVSDAGPV